MFSYWIYTLFTDKHPLHFKVRTAKDKQFVQQIWWDVLPGVCLQIFPVNFPSAHSEAALQRSPWTASVIHLGKTQPQPIDLKGLFHLRVSTPSAEDLPAEAGMEIEFLQNRVKMAQEHLLRPGPENKGFHGVWKKLINRELSELKPPGF